MSLISGSYSRGPEAGALVNGMSGDVCIDAMGGNERVKRGVRVCLAVKATGLCLEVDCMNPLRQLLMLAR